MARAPRFPTRLNLKAILRIFLGQCSALECVRKLVLSLRKCRFDGGIQGLLGLVLAACDFAVYRNPFDMPGRKGCPHLLARLSKLQ